MKKPDGKAARGRSGPQAEHASAPSSGTEIKANGTRNLRPTTATSLHQRLTERLRRIGARLAPYKILRVLVLITLPGILLTVMLAAFNLHQSGFVIHARTEAVRILAIKSHPNDGWRIDNAMVCEDRPFTAAEPDPQPICLNGLPPEPFFTPADGSAVTIRSLEPGRLEAVIVPAVPFTGGDETATARPKNGSGNPSRLRAYAGGSAEITFTNTVRITWSHSTPHSPLVFLGPALIGFAPESGIPGLTLGGTAAGYMAARAGAPRFEISRAEIVPGDVLGAETPNRRSYLSRQLCHSLASIRLVDSESCVAAGPMHGVVLYDAKDRDHGFEIVYAGPAHRIIVDRLGTRFELAPDWTSRVRNDPLLLLLSGAVTLMISIAGLVLGLRKGNG